MARSIKTHSGTGVDTDFLFDIPYIKEADVHGYVNDIEVSISFVDPTTVRFAVAPALGADNIQIKRHTDEIDARHLFPTKTYITSTRLDGNTTQQLYLHQEALDLLDLQINAAAEAAAAAVSAAEAAAAAASLQNESVSGFIATYVTASTTSISKGSTLSSDSSTQMGTASAIVKDFTVAWSAGTGNGSWDGRGTAPASLFGLIAYYVIFNPTTLVTDILTSWDDGVAPVLPSGYTKYRKVASIYEASGAQTSFIQTHNELVYKSAIQTLTPAGLVVNTKYVLDTLAPAHANILGVMSTTTTGLLGASDGVRFSTNADASGVLLTWQEFHIARQENGADSFTTNLTRLKTDTSGSGKINIGFTYILSGGTVVGISLKVFGYTTPFRDSI